LRFISPNLSRPKFILLTSGKNLTLLSIVKQNNQSNMKKFSLLLAFFTLVSATRLFAQEAKPANDLNTRIEQAQEKWRSPLMEKAGLTDIAANRVILLHMTYDNRLQSFKKASADVQKKMSDEIRGAEDREYRAMNLNPEKITIIHNFFDQQQKLEAKAAN